MNVDDEDIVFKGFTISTTGEWLKLQDSNSAETFYRISSINRFSYFNYRDPLWAQMAVIGLLMSVLSGGTSYFLNLQQLLIAAYVFCILSILLFIIWSLAFKIRIILRCGQDNLVFDGNKNNTQDLLVFLKKACSLDDW